MRSSMAVFLAASVSVMGPASGVLAEEADATWQRVEVPEVGLAVAFPPDWAVDIELDVREDFFLSEQFPEAAPVTFQNVLYASATGRPWCAITWYPAHPMSLDEYAVLLEALWTAEVVERTIEVAPVELPAGPAYRLVIHNEPSDDYTTVYLLGSGPSRILLGCVSDERQEGDWLALAETLESSGTGSPGLPCSSPAPSVVPSEPGSDQ